MPLSRRSWLRQTLASTPFLGAQLRAEPPSSPALPPPNPLSPGCFNRPWMRWTYPEALAAIRSIGFKTTGILGDHAGEPFTSPEATATDLQRLKDRIHASGLVPIVGWLRTRHDLPLETSLAQARQQIDHAQALNLKQMLTTGVDPAPQFDHFFHVMRGLAPYAQERGIQLVIKPHGGVSASAEELLRCMEQVNHPNFRIWYDAGNVIHYTGKDPVEDLKRIAPFVTGFCAKDCAAKGGGVMLQFGQGCVDFPALFRILKSARFQGPVMMECCAGETLEQVTAHARANREYLLKTLAAVGLA